MVELNNVIKVWNSRWGHRGVRNLFIEPRKDQPNFYAQIGFSSPTRKRT